MNAKVKNPFGWLEIYVDDITRAQKFYETVLQIKMVNMKMPEGMENMQMISFPWNEAEGGISGALVKMENMKPGAGGTLAYFSCEDCSEEIARVTNAGGIVYQEKFSIGDYGYCGICADTEGNSIGFHSMK